MSTMEHIISFRATDEQVEFLKAGAQQTGCHSISEFVRRKALDVSSDGMREIIFFIKEMCLSSLAHHNLLLDISGVNVDTRDELIQQKKIDIIEAWEEKNETE